MNEPAKSSAGKLSISPPICDGFFSGDGSVCWGVSVGGVCCTCRWMQCRGVGLWHTGTYMCACVCTHLLTHIHTHKLAHTCSHPPQTHILPITHTHTHSHLSIKHRLLCTPFTHFFFNIQKHRLTPVHTQKHKVPQQIDLCGCTSSQSPRATETHSSHVWTRELDPKEG